MLPPATNGCVEEWELESALTREKEEQEEEELMQTEIKGMKKEEN